MKQVALEGFLKKKTTKKTKKKKQRYIQDYRDI